MEEPGFWDNADKANNSMKELKNLKDTVEEYHRLETAWEDVETLLEMGYEENESFPKYSRISIFISGSLTALTPLKK